MSKTKKLYIFLEEGDNLQEGDEVLEGGKWVYVNECWFGGAWGKIHDIIRREVISE